MILFCCCWLVDHHVKSWLYYVSAMWCVPRFRHKTWVGKGSSERWKGEVGLRGGGGGNRTGKRIARGNGKDKHCILIINLSLPKWHPIKGTRRSTLLGCAVLHMTPNWSKYNSLLCKLFSPTYRFSTTKIWKVNALHWWRARFCLCPSTPPRHDPRHSPYSSRNMSHSHILQNVGRPSSREKREGGGAVKERAREAICRLLKPVRVASPPQTPLGGKETRRRLQYRLSSSY